MPNPERKRVERELEVKRQELARRRAELGQALLHEPAWGRTARGLKVAQRRAVGQLQALGAGIETRLDRRAELPARVPLGQTGKREVLRLEHKAIIDRVKITAYNAEEWLLDLLVPHYPNPHDVRALLRSFAELSGEIRATVQGVVVTLDSPDLPFHGQALRGLCADLNRLGSTQPGRRVGPDVQTSELGRLHLCTMGFTP